MRGNRFKTTILLITIVLSMVCIPFTANAASIFNDVEYSKIRAATTVDSLKAKSALLIDAATGTVLFEKNANERLPMASITKIMTMLIVMEKIEKGELSLDTIVSVSAHAQSMIGSGVFLEKGQKHSVKDLLKAVSIPSANDASVALAEHIAGTENIFVGLMNSRAAELGMKDTHFADCTGLTEINHYSTAHDITIMARELTFNHPSIFEISTIWHDKFDKYDMDNTNKLVRYYTDTGKGVICNGLKTGFTDAAGYCICSTAENENMKVVGVILGAPDTNTRFGEAAVLLDYGLANFETRLFGNKEEILSVVPVKKGVSATIDAACEDQVPIVCKRGSAQKINSEVITDESLIAPIEKGQKIGEVIYKIDDKEVGKANLVAMSEVKKASFFRLFFRMILEWLGIRAK